MSQADTLDYRRNRIVWLGFLVLLVILAVRVSDLQLFQHKHFSNLAVGQQSRKFSVAAKRGEIYWYDKDIKVPAVLNQEAKVLYADANFVVDKAQTAQKLAALTGGSASEYLNKLNKSGSYISLEDRLSPDVAAKIQKQNLPGIGLASQPVRVYPEGSIGSQMLGFVNTDGKGQYGLEGYMDKELIGSPGSLKTKTDIFGIPIATADNIDKPPKDGSSLTLTVDRNTQSQAEKFLKEGVDNVRAKSGSIVVIDPRSGAVRAMANYPSYDPSRYSEAKDYSIFQNAVVGDQFEPGSGFKVIAMAAGLDSGKLKPETIYNDTGPIKVDGYEIGNAEEYFGPSDMNDVIQKSLNTGMVFVLKKLGGNPDKITDAGKKLLHKYITSRFKFGEKTGIEQTGEALGAVNPPASSDVNYANMTFGQGISVTMMQMVAGISAIANGGNLFKPYLVESVKSSDGNVVRKDPIIMGKNVVSLKTSQQLKNMMVQVVEHGSGWRAKTPGYSIAGKTGTAQIPRADGKGYEQGKNIGSFVGFAPVDNPEFVIMVRIVEPQYAGFAESTTVPVFAQLTRWLLNYYNIPPSG